MDAQQFVAEFGHLANAPGGVRRLRDMILALAVQGRLVEQRHQEESAIIQLDRIKAKALSTITTTRNRRKANAESAISSQSLPPGWCSARLSDLVRVLNGRAYSKTEFLNTGTPILRVGNLFTSDKWYYSDLKLDDDKYCIKGDLLYAWSASFGPFIWNGERSIFHYHIWKLDLFSEVDVDKKFLYTWLLEKTQEIKASGHGISMAHMTKENFEHLVIDLPPMQEQARIVAKVDELMALCDKLEAQQQAREKRKAVLAQALLTRFAEEPTQANLHSLFHSSRAITPADLRNAILTLAVQGRLVPQDLNDEPGVRSLERIREFATQNGVGKGSAQRSDTLTLPFEIPNGWATTRIGSILSPNRIISYGVIKLGSEPQEDGVFILRCSNVRFRKIDLRGVRKITKELSSEYDRTILEGGEVLINVRGTLGGCAVVPSGLKGYNIAREVAVIPIHPEINSSFILNVIASPYFQGRVAENLRGIAYEGLNLGLLRDFSVPIPPFAEQKRIVKKVEELMALVDKLEIQLATANTVGKRLVETVVSTLTGITTSEEQDLTVKAPPTELIATLRLGRQPDRHQQAPLATELARHQGSMAVRDLLQRFNGSSDIDAFYAQLKTEVANGWIQEPTEAEMRVKPLAATDA